MSRKHVPIRFCVGCGKRSPKQELIRIRVDAKGSLVVGEQGEGRGAYLHNDPSCWEAFGARKGLVRSLRRSVERDVRQALVRKLAGTAKQD
ncbi:hypothetical protein HRbin30_03172 [bacterium HR30]|nr:hypothetical protein HRbin30_03172 [bacterium HR30]